MFNKPRTSHSSSNNYIKFITNPQWQNVAVINLGNFEDGDEEGDMGETGDKDDKAGDER